MPHFDASMIQRAVHFLQYDAGSKKTAVPRIGASRAKARSSKLHSAWHMPPPPPVSGTLLGTCPAERFSLLNGCITHYSQLLVVFRK
jgi:hypothetical protein